MNYFIILCMQNITKQVPIPIAIGTGLVLHLKGLDYPHKEICRICRISKPTLIKYFNEFTDEGISGIKKLKWKGQLSKLNEYKDLIDKDFENNPPKMITEAHDRIEKLTGIKRCPTQIQSFIKKLNYKFLKVGSIPGNGDGKDEQREEEREQFKKKSWNHYWKKQKKEKE